MKHTPEPWGLMPGNKEQITNMVNHDDPLYHVETNGDNAVYDALRIVACVNACAGIPTDALESYSRMDCAAKADKRLNDAKAQRDALAAALRLHDAYQTDMEKAGFGAYSATEMCAVTDAALNGLKSP